MVTTFFFMVVAKSRIMGVSPQLLDQTLRKSLTAASKSVRKIPPRHIVFVAEDGLQASIPIESALDPFGDVILAHSMNGEPLNAEHGYPLRLVVPGHVGVRNVKWLTHIVASTEEAYGPWQRGIAYKGFAPGINYVVRINNMPGGNAELA